MALPTLTKSWNFSVNNYLPSRVDSYTYRRYLLYALKAAFVTMGWTVPRSSDASTFGNSDLWTDYSKVNASDGGNRSWIILKAPSGFSTTYPEFSLMIDWYSPWTMYNGGCLHVECSYGGYNLSTGALNVHPSSTLGDEIILLCTVGSYNDSVSWDGSQYNNLNCVLHAMWAADKSAFRVFTVTGNVVNRFWQVEKVANPLPTVGQWPDPIIVNIGCGNDSYNYCGYGYFNDGCWGGYVWGQTQGKSTSSAQKSRTLMTAGEAAFYLSSDGLSTSTVGEAWGANDISGGYPISPISVIGGSTNINRGRIGTLADVWWGSTSVICSETYPADGSKQFIQLGHMIFPWDGASVPLIG